MSAALALHQPASPSLGATDEERAEALRRNRLRQSLTDDDWSKKIAAFRELFGLARFDLAIPHPLVGLRAQLHAGLFAEEAGETLGFHGEMREQFVNAARGVATEVAAYTVADFAEIVDGILDTIVVGLGWLREMGFSTTQIMLLMQEVHASNMTKVDNTGQPVYDANGKVQKGANYVKADIAGLIASFINAAQPKG